MFTEKEKEGRRGLPRLPEGKVSAPARRGWHREHPTVTTGGLANWPAHHANPPTRSPQGPNDCSQHGTRAATPLAGSGAWATRVN